MIWLGGTMAYTSAFMVGVTPALPWHNRGVEVTAYVMWEMGDVFTASAVYQDPRPESLSYSCFHGALQEESL